MGIGKHADIVHLIDFGLLKKFRNPNTYVHIPYHEGLGLTRTAMFASIHSHLSMELGRRDDLESLAYVLIYFLHSTLPWQGLKYKRCDCVVESKQGTSAYDLCLGLPVEFCDFLEYSCSLSFHSKPDYSYLHNLFDDLLSQERCQDDPAFDWEVLPELAS